MRETFPPIYVLRHGETEWNREGRLQGHLDSPLTALGRGQAAGQNAILRRHLPEGATAISSDSGRSVETARRALEGLDLPLRYDPRLREVALGDWQGLTIAEVERGWGFLTEGRDPFDWKFDAPGGESLAVFAARARAVLDGSDGAHGDLHPWPDIAGAALHRAGPAAGGAGRAAGRAGGGACGGERRGAGADGLSHRRQPRLRPCQRKTGGL
jgi:hypothetical protein